MSKPDRVRDRWVSLLVALFVWLACYVLTALPAVIVYGSAEQLPQGVTIPLFFLNVAYAVIGSDVGNRVEQAVKTRRAGRRSRR